MSSVRLIHVLNRIERIEKNIKELVDIEKAIPQKREYHQALYLAIEKEINRFLDERIKLRDLKIENPPENLKPENREIDEDMEEEYMPSLLDGSLPVSPKTPVQEKHREASVDSSQMEETETVAGVSTASSLEKFARSLDLDAPEEKKEAKKTTLDPKLPKTRQDILNDLSQIDY